MTRAGARLALQALGYGTDTASAQNEAIESVVRRVLGMRRWPWNDSTPATINTVSGTAALDASATEKYDSLRIAQGTTYLDLEYEEPEAFLDEQHTDRTNGIPTHWTVVGAELRLRPTPDGVYAVSVRRQKTLSEYTISDVAELPGPPEHHDVYVWGAAVIMAVRGRDLQLATYFDGQFSARLREWIGAGGVRQRQDASTVNSSGFYESLELE